MKYLTFIGLALAILLTACQSQQIVIPSAQTSCELQTESHPHQRSYEELLAQYTQDHFVGISLVVDDPPYEIWAGGAGWADVEQGIDMTACHIHYAASINKTYLATIILQLQEEGKLSLDETLSTYLPAEVLDPLPNGNALTIRHLLQCRSGIPDVFEASFLLDFLNQPTRSYSMEELLTYVEGVEPLGAPGARHDYGDANFILLSMIIEQLDEPIPVAFEKRIFRPIRAEQSYLIESPTEAPVGLAASYWDRLGKGAVENVSDYQLALAAGLEGTDGLLCSVGDLHKFVQGLTDGTLLSPASWAEMIDFVDIPEGQSQQNYQAYGLGFARINVSGEDWYGSFGNHVGASAMILYHPQRQITVAAAQNTGTFFHDSLKRAFFADLILDIEAIVLE